MYMLIQMDTVDLVSLVAPSRPRLIVARPLQASIFRCRKGLESTY